MKIGLSHLEIRVICLVLSHFQCFVEGQQKLLHIKNTKEEIYIINKKIKRGIVLCHLKPRNSVTSKLDGMQNSGSRCISYIYLKT